jgi:hypothetical protein
MSTDGVPSTFLPDASAEGSKRPDTTKVDNGDATTAMPEPTGLNPAQETTATADDTSVEAPDGQDEGTRKKISSFEELRPRIAYFDEAQLPTDEVIRIEFGRDDLYELDIDNLLTALRLYGEPSVRSSWIDVDVTEQWNYSEALLDIRTLVNPKYTFRGIAEIHSAHRESANASYTLGVISFDRALDPIQIKAAIARIRAINGVADVEPDENGHTFVIEFTTYVATSRLRAERVMIHVARATRTQLEENIRLIRTEKQDDASNEPSSPLLQMMLAALSRRPQGNAHP